MREVGRLTGKSHYLAPLLGSKSGWRTWSLGVLQSLNDRVRRALNPMLPPQSHAYAGGLQTMRDFSSIETVSQQQNDSSTKGNLLACFMRSY
jgi:hypothetical protein